MQQTVAKAFTQSGVGLHTGLEVQVLPAAAGTGRYFVRVDMHSQPIIPARVEAVSQTFFRLSWVGRTVHGGASVGSAGNDGCGYARIEIDGPEVPLLDGSALWVEAIASVGLVSQSVPSHGEHSGSHLQGQWVYQGDAFVAALPAPEARYLRHRLRPPAIGNQWHSWLPL